MGLLCHFSKTILYLPSCPITATPPVQFWPGYGHITKVKYIFNYFVILIINLYSFFSILKVAIFYIPQENKTKLNCVASQCVYLSRDPLLGNLPHPHPTFSKISDS